MDLKLVYNIAVEFLNKKIDEHGYEIDLSDYQNHSNSQRGNLPIEGVFRALLKSAQNSNMKAGVIGKAIGGIDKLAPVVYDFSPFETASNYGNDSSRLLQQIIIVLNPNGKKREGKRSLWPQYAQTILSAADFLTQFNSGEEFYKWADYLYNDDRSMPVLPLILSMDIHGFGYALACDFLKELGYLNYGKPDVHIMRIFKNIGIADKKASPYHVQKVILEVAKANDVTPYNVDKTFWLIGSGKLYRENPELSIGRNAAEFIEYYKTQVN